MQPTAFTAADWKLFQSGQWN